VSDDGRVDGRSVGGKGQGVELTKPVIMVDMAAAKGLCLGAGEPRTALKTVMRFMMVMKSRLNVLCLYR
jgi:hypothetical protein